MAHEGSPKALEGYSATSELAVAIFRPWRHSFHEMQQRLQERDVKPHANNTIARSAKTLHFGCLGSIAIGVLTAAGCASVDTTKEETFLTLETRLSDALAAYDAATVDELWDDDLVFVFPNGKVARKSERMAAQRRPSDAAGPVLVSHNDAVDVSYRDSNVAVVVVHSTWRFGDNPPEPFLATHVWIKRVRGWRLLSAQVAEVKFAH